ncbi:MAG: hypothetical protein CMO26_06265 [Thiotrichales bacterium]|nr:hypothetical protein [Thiotrichales bacterium]
MTLIEAVEQAKRDGVEIAHVGIFDLFGTFRERRLRIDDVVNVMDGGGTFVNVLPQWDAGEQVFGSGPFVGESVNIDPESIRPYPFESNACLMIAEYTGASAPFSARGLVKQLVEKAETLGFGVRAAIESEFIVLNEDAASLRENGFGVMDTFAKDNRCWAGESAAIQADFVSELHDTLAGGGLDLLSLSGELGPGCFESTLRVTDPVRAAEDHLLLKMYTKAFCRRHGLTASFMAQLGSGFPGLSQHPHVSLTDQNSGEPAFQSSDDGTLKAPLRQFVAGMTVLMPDAMALTHHNPNAYRRHAPGNWAPKSVSWARQNYSAAIRVVTEPAERRRVEYRLPGADANPLLNLAFVLGAGLWGVENEATLPAEFEGGGPDVTPEGAASLPHDLYVAADRLDRCKVAREIWGAEFIDHYLAAIRAEEAALRKEASAAERARYLEVV